MRFLRTLIWLWAEARLSVMWICCDLRVVVRTPVWASDMSNRQRKLLCGLMCVNCSQWTGTASRVSTTMTRVLMTSRLPCCIWCHGGHAKIRFCSHVNNLMYFVTLGNLVHLSGKLMGCFGYFEESSLNLGTNFRMFMRHQNFINVYRENFFHFGNQSSLIWNNRWTTDLIHLKNIFIIGCLLLGTFQD